MPVLGPFLATNLIHSILGVAVAAGILVLFGATGKPARGWLAGRRARGVGAVDPFLGVIMVGSAVLGLAAAGLCRPLPVLLLAAAGVGAGLPLVRDWTAGPGRSDAAFSGVPVLVSIALLLPVLVLPEYYADCMECHLTMPQSMLGRGRLPAPPITMSWTWFLLFDFTNAIPLALGSDESVRMVGIVLAVTGGTNLLAVLSPALTRRQSAVVWAALLAATCAPAVALSAKNDLAVCGMALAALALAAGGAGGPLLGVLAGGAVAVKLVVAPFVVCAAGFGVVGKNWVRRTGWTAGGAVMVLAPWIGRSWFQFGDPGAPFLTQFLPFLTVDRPYLSEIRDQFGVIVERGVTFISRLASRRWDILAAIALAAAAFRPAWKARSRGLLTAIGCGLIGALIVAAAYPGRSGDQWRHGFMARSAMLLAALAGWIGTPKVLALRWSRGGVPAVYAIAALALPAIAGWRAAAFTPEVRWEEPRGRQLWRDYLLGRRSAEEYRNGLLGACGRLLPAIHAAPRRPGRPGILVEEGSPWKLPQRVLQNGWFTPFIWRSVKETRDARRLAVRFRQAGIGHVLYDAEVAAWEQTYASPFAWDEGMLARYSDFAARSFRVVATAPCEGPGFGYSWLIEVMGDPAARKGPVDVLPEADGALAAATMLGLRGKVGPALEEGGRINRVIPGVTGVEAWYGYHLVMAGRTREGYPLVREAARRGWAGCVVPAVVGWSIGAARLGHTDEAAAAYRAALELHPRWEAGVKAILSEGPR